MGAHKNCCRKRIEQIRRGTERCSMMYYGKKDLLETKESMGIEDEKLKKQVRLLKMQMKNRGAL